jgi:hypothetical protein
MRGALARGVVAAALLAGACSVNEATSNAGNMDAPAQRACQDAQGLVQARSSGRMSARQLRAQAEQIYNEAQASANPIIQARAVAVFTDATLMAEGDEGRTFDADLAAMSQACSRSGG